MAKLFLKSLLVGAAAFVASASVSLAADTIDISYIATTSGASAFKGSLQATFDGSNYSATFNGKTTGVTNMLAKYKIGLSASGSVADGKLTPSKFAKTTSKKKKDKFANVTFSGGTTTTETQDGPLKETAAVEAAVKGKAADPLTAILRFAIAQGASGAKPCTGTQRFYDGRDVGDLTLSLVKKSAASYHCNLTLKSIAGRNVENKDDATVTYGLWLVPVTVRSSNTPLYMPARLTGTYTGLNVSVEATGISVNGAGVAVSLVD
jgi:Protein of unknown function (DUF3108)